MIAGLLLVAAWALEDGRSGARWLGLGALNSAWEPCSSATALLR